MSNPSDDVLKKIKKLKGALESGVDVFEDFIEGLAMGAFATLYSKSKDPLLVKLTQLVMTDEAFHHKFGKIWADRTIPKLDAEEHNKIEDWAWQVFSTLLYNIASPEQKKEIYAQVGLDWKWVQDAFMEGMTDEKMAPAGTDMKPDMSDTGMKSDSWSLPKPQT